MAFYVIDRIEGTTAVIVADDDREFNVPRRALPKGSREGTVLRIDAEMPLNPDWATAVIDEEEWKRRLEHSRDTLRRLSKKDPGGDIEL
jgi:hypothetical protein